MTPIPLRFTVLGDVRVWRDGAEVDPGPPLRRTLLALLLARAGSPVPLADIVDALWEERPPTHAVNMVHRHVGALRRLLEPGLPNRAEGSLLLRGGGGYRLLAPSGSVDLQRFHQLAQQARDLLRRNDRNGTDTVVDLYVQALALRQGPAAGCPVQAPAHPVFTELDRAYDAVVREAAEVALGCGRADRVLPALSASAARHPLDEGLQARLLLALAATGRTAAALEVFRSTAARLADELGVDPGPELIDARRQVTAAEGGHGAVDGTRDAEPDTEQAPGAPAPAPAHTPAPDTPPAPTAPPFKPAQLPPALSAFAGRDAELDRLRALLTGAAAAEGHGGPTAAITIGGQAGVGKTALAVRLAHEVADRFPDGQLYVNLRGFDLAAAPLRPQDAVRGFLDALGVPAARIPEGLDAQAALFRSLLAGRRLLVLLDNARDAAQVRPLLPGASGCVALVTSRSRLTGLASADGAHPLTLDVLTPPEALSALALRVGDARVAAEPQAAAEIVSLTAGLPLALAVVAARAAAHPAFALATPAEQLREAHGGLDALRDNDPAIDVRTVFSWSYDELAPAAARLFRLLALHPGPELTVHQAAALVGESVGRSRALLAELTDTGLLAERSPGRYACHDLLRAYATELVHAFESADERRAALRRLLDHVLHSAHGAALLFDPPTSVITPVAPAEGAHPSDTPARPQRLADEATALAWFTAERAVLLGALRQAVDHGFDTHVWQLAWCLERFHERHGPWSEYLAVQRTALAAAQRLGDPVALAQAHRGLGRACMMLRHYDEAHHHLRASLGEFAGEAPETDHGHGRAQSHLALWTLMTRQGRFRDGLEELPPALLLYRASGHRRGQADVLVAMAWGEACLGNGQDALTHAHRALALFQELGIRLAEGYAWDTLGHVHRQLGRHERSMRCHRRALTLFREVGDLFNEACVLDRLGDAQHASGRVTEALGTWREALGALQDVDPLWAAEVEKKIAHHLAPTPVTSQAHFVHCPLPTLQPASSGPQGP